MLINVIDQQSELKISIDQVQHIVQQVLYKEGQVCDEINIYFVDTPTICQLHDQFFQDPSPTDCISFPMDEEEDKLLSFRILGEVFVCPAIALSYAIEHQTNAYEETTLYIVHGLLHLLGYDDLTDEDCVLMRQAEGRHMQELKKFQLQLYPLTY